MIWFINAFLATFFMRQVIHLPAFLAALEEHLS